MDDSQTAKAALAAAFEAAIPGQTTLSDGRQELAWERAPQALAELVAFFAEQGIAPHDPVALECTNSVPGALTLLALLWQGSTVVLLPHPGPSAPPSTPLPRFLTKRIRVRHGAHQPGAGADAGDRSVSGWHPQTFLDSHPIDDSRPLPTDSPLRRHHLILRTSGSLAEPKWVVHTHTGLLGNARNAIERLALESTDRVLIPVPLGHMYGLGAGFLPALAVGASIELLEGANLIRYLERERTFRPTVAYLTPNLCAMLLRPRSAPEHYRHVVVAGDKLGASTFHQAEAIYRRVVNLYGSTEMGVICAGDARQPAASASLTVGHPLPGVRLRIDKRSAIAGGGDPDGDAGGAGGLPRGIEPREGTEANADGSEGGELLCAHPYGFAGYRDLDGAPVATESAAGPEWYATRDLARWHDDGAVEVLGRSDHATNRDGRLVMLAEVERALARLPGVAGAAVVLAEPTLRGRAMIAFVSAPSGADLDLGHLRRASREALPSYAVPDEIRLLPALPLLPSGKLDRRTLERTILIPSTPEASRDHGTSPP